MNAALAGSGVYSSMLPWLLLAASAALNVFFIGGAAYYMIAAERLAGDPQARIDFVAERLKLSAEERAGLGDWHSHTRERWQAVRGERQNLRSELLAELEKPELDAARVESLAQARAELRVPVLLDTVKELHGYLGSLSPEAKAEFLAMARERDFFRRLFGRGGRGGPAERCAGSHARGH